MPQGNDLRGGTYGNGTLVLVGDAGSVVTSTDGRNWLGQNSHIANNLLCPQPSAIRCLWHVGANGTITTSPDGTSWSPRNSGSTNVLYGSAFGNGLFVSVGQLGTILTSSNGVDWAAQTSGTRANLRAVTYGNAQFLAVGDAGPTNATILSSTNGTDWVASSLPFRQSLISATFKDTSFFVLTSNGWTYTSTNGINWVNRMDGFQYMNGVGSSPDFFAMVDGEGGSVVFN